MNLRSCSLSLEVAVSRVTASLFSMPNTPAGTILGNMAKSARKHLPKVQFEDGNEQRVLNMNFLKVDDEQIFQKVCS